MANRKRSAEPLEPKNKKPCTVKSHSMLTRQATTAASRRAVVDTSELLEGILVHLPAPQLLQVRNVCKYWRDLVDTAPKLQTVLFLRPMAAEAISHWILDSQTQGVKKHEPGEEKEFGPDWTKRQGKVEISTPNPIIFLRESKALTGEMGVVERFRLCETLRFNARPSLSNTKSIVRKMFVCQPPAKKLVFYFQYYTAKPGWTGPRGKIQKVRVTVRNEDGVTVGDMMNEFLKEVGPGSEKRPSDGYALRVAKCCVWCLGVVFVSKEERMEVEGIEPVAPVKVVMKRGRRSADHGKLLRGG